MPRRAAARETAGGPRSMPRRVVPCSAVPHHYEPRHHRRHDRRSGITDLVEADRVGPVPLTRIQTFVHETATPLSYLRRTLAARRGTARPVVRFVPALVKRMSRRQTRRAGGACVHFCALRFYPARKL